MPTLPRRICDAVAPPVCRYIVARMRQLEETIDDPARRWTVLRSLLSAIAQDTKGSSS